MFYDADINEDMNAVILSILEQPGTFTDMVIRSARELVKSDGDQMEAVTSTGVQYTVTRPIPYGLFLKRISQNTNVPVTTLHNALCEYVKRHGHIEQKFFNDNSAIEFCSRFRDWKTKHLQGRFHYAKSRTPCGATALTYADGTPRTDIAQGRIGTKIIPGTPSAKYLYDVYAYDSPLEKDNITANIEEVVVFGKIPRSSIAIPTITGEMYSPDFMYIVKRKSGEKELNIVVETKDVEGKSSLRPIENAKIECARMFFDMLSRDGYTVYFRDQLNNKQMAQIINEVLT